MKKIEEFKDNSRDCGSTKCAKEKIELRRQLRSEVKSSELFDALLKKEYAKNKKLAAKYEALKAENAALIERVQALETSKVAATTPPSRPAADFNVDLARET